MRKHPEYKYAIDSVMSVEYFKLNYPEMLDELKQRVNEGRMELMGGMIVAPDVLMPSGENLVRQCLYGTMYFKENFGVDSKVSYFLDSFGQTPQMPQLLKKAGFETLIFYRGIGHRSLPNEFLWKGLDGSKIFVHWLSYSYTWITLPFTGTILPPIFPFFAVPFTLNIIPQYFKVYEILKTLFPPFKWIMQRLNNLNVGVSLLGSDMSAGLPFTVRHRLQRASTNNVFVLNGTDNIPPSTNIIDAVKYLQKKRKDYNLKIATPSEFIASVKKVRKSFGVVEQGDFNGAPFKFPGTFSTRIRLKQKIRSIENQFYLTELMCTLALIRNKYPYPREEIKKGIIRLLRCDFHDSLPGCHVDACYDDIMKQLRISELQLKRLLRNALTDLTKSNSSTPSKNILVLNTLSVDRTEVVSLKTTGSLQDFIIKDNNGNIINYQRDTINPSENRVLLIADKIPSLGYKTYGLEAFKPKQEESSANINLTCQGNITEVKNENFILTFENNKLRTITDIKHDFKIEAGRYNINDLRILNDRGDSYLTGKLPKKSYTTFDNQLHVIENGPARIVIEIKSKLQCKNKWFSKPINEITQYIILTNDHSSRIDFITKFKNNIRNIRIEACFPNNFKNPKFHSEVPYGFVERDTKPRIGKCFDDFKKGFSYYDRVFPVINWMDVSDPNQKRGTTVINNGLPSYEISEDKSTLYLTLMRSTGYVGTVFPSTVPMVLGPMYNIPKALELTEQEFHYSILFHDGDLAKNHVTTAALKHNVPIITEVIDNSSGHLKKEESFIKIEPENFLITAVKASEKEDNAIIIRIIETSNKQSKGKITLNHQVKEVHLANLLEEPIKELQIVSNNSFEFLSNSQEILTFLIEL